MAKVNCLSCGRDTESTTGLCYKCRTPSRLDYNGQGGKSRGRKQLSAKAHFLDPGEVPRFDPIDSEADKDKEWDGFDFD